MIGCDVLIVGAGPAACAAAVRTACAGLSTIVLDRPRPASNWPGESLPPGLGEVLRSVFGDGALTESGHRRAIGTRSAWGSTDLVETDFLLNPLGEGWLLDRARLEATARHGVRAQGVRILPFHPLTSLAREGSCWRLGLGEGREIRARFLIDASGRAAALVRRMGVRRIAADRQIALVAAYPDDGDAYCGTTVEAVADGWWYTTPLPDGRRVLAYLTDADLWRRSPRNWQALLTETLHIGRCAGRNARSALPVACPAGTTRAERLAGDGWLAVGDAAMCFDPLSSQGLASAVLMGARAGDAIADPDRAAAVDAWAEDYRMLYAEHADLRTHYARQETRWPQSAFWRRRQQWRELTPAAA